MASSKYYLFHTYVHTFVHYRSHDDISGRTILRVPFKKMYIALVGLKHRLYIQRL